MPTLLVLLLMLGLAHPSEGGPTLSAIKKRGRIRCGTSNGMPGFSTPDSQGKWKGLDIDSCRAFAAAVFGDSEKFIPTGLSFQQRFAALQSGEVDVLTRTTTHTLTRDTSLGFNFAPTTYYDGQGFIVKASSGIKSIKELGGAAVCIQQGTTTERNTADYFRTNKLRFRPVVMENNDELFNAFMSGRCDAYTADASNLAADRTRIQNRDSLVILPTIISKEPLGPLVRHGDDEWFDIVKWSIYAMIAAEEMGITSENVDSMKQSSDPDIRRFLGVTPGNGNALGLNENWAYNIIKQVGNYGESFENNVGVNTPLKLQRGLNALWTKGGLMYAPPLK